MVKSYNGVANVITGKSKVTPRYSYRCSKCGTYKMDKTDLDNYRCGEGPHIPSLEKPDFISSTQQIQNTIDRLKNENSSMQ